MPSTENPVAIKATEKKNKLQIKYICSLFETKMKAVNVKNVARKKINGIFLICACDFLFSIR